MLKIAIKLRIHPPKRRSPMARLKARMYYRRNRAKIRVQRRKYLRIHRTQIKHRKMFMRYKPNWFKKPKKVHHLRPKRFKVSIPGIKHPKKFKFPGVRHPKKPHFFKAPRRHIPKPHFFKAPKRHN